MDKMEELMIREFYENERTELGKSVIRQLCAVLGVEIDE